MDDKEFTARLNLIEDTWLFKNPWMQYLLDGAWDRPHRQTATEIQCLQGQLKKAGHRADL